MEVRNRSFSTSVALGEVYTLQHGYHETLGIGSAVVEERTCMDYIKKKRREDSSLPASPCYITWKSRDPLCMVRNTPGYIFLFSGYPVNAIGDISEVDFENTFTPKGSADRNNENAVLVQELLARTNPFRYEYSVPVALKEMIDVIQLFKISTASFAAFAGSAYLNYKFGWVQFVQDLKTLSEITVAVERRIKELDSLTRKGGLRRKVHLRSGGISRSGNAYVNSTWGLIFQAHWSRHCSVQTHGTVRWRLRPEIKDGVAGLTGWNRAVREVLDLEELDGQTAWNLIPFSWLLDYFVNISDFLGGVEGAEFIEPYDICIVRRGEATLTQYPPPGLSDLNLGFTGSGRVNFRFYDRDVVVPGSLPAVRVGILNKHQLLVIAALIASFKR